MKTGLNVNMSTVDPNSDDIQLMRVMFEILSKYTWLIPVLFGIPGNMICIVVTTREHNRRLSTCVYMTAMAAVDSLLLVGQACFIPLFWWNLLPDDVGFKLKETLFQYVFIFV